MTEKILRQTCVTMNYGLVVGIKVVFILGSVYEIILGIDKRTELGVSIGNYNVPFWL